MTLPDYVTDRIEKELWEDATDAELREQYEIAENQQMREDEARNN